VPYEAYQHDWLGAVPKARGSIGMDIDVDVDPMSSYQVS
jgi:hypothetical protein